MSSWKMPFEFTALRVRIEPCPSKLGIILLGLTILIGEFARRFRVKRETQMRHGKIFSLGLTGAQFAEKILDAKGVEGVEIVESRAATYESLCPESQDHPARA